MIKLKHSNSKRGVALVVTIGMLAILILSAVAFSISMRVERLAARNFADVVQARQWAQSALTLAMADMETQIGNKVMLPDSFNRVILSSGTGANLSPRLYSQSATNYIPYSLRTDAAQDIKWKDQAESGKTVARYAYQIIDCSGFIDANFGGLTNVPSVRGVATNAMNIWLDQSVLNELVTTREADLKRGLNLTGITGAGGNNSPWYEFATLADLWQVAGTPAAGATHGAGIFASRPANFFTYSRFLPGYSANANLLAANALFLGHTQQYWDANKATLRGTIQAQLQAMGAGIPDAASLAANIVDYCDSDDIPELNIRDNFSMEATPLANEISLDLAVSATGPGAFQMTFTPHLEVWYPFVGYTNKGNYEAYVRVDFGGDANYSFFQQTPAAPLIAPGGTWDYNNGNDYYVKDYAALTYNASALPTAALYVDISAVIRPVGGGGNVDFVFKRRVPLPNINGAPPRNAGIMIDDPRFNSVTYNKWVETGNAVATPRAATLTPPYINTGVITHDTGANSDFSSLGLAAPWVFWPNRVLQTTGELGLQAYDSTKAWATIPLLGAGAAAVPVLDRFFISSNKQGRINLNTWSLPVLRTAFHSCPASGYPGQSSTAISSADRDALASAINPLTFENLSELRQLPTTVGGLNRLETEGIIRDTAEILGVRQNIFTILVAAQSISDVGAVLGEQRGLAVVWRDPYADSTGYHPSFVRSFRWLTD